MQARVVGRVSARRSIIPPAFRELVFWEVQAFLLSVIVAYVYAWRRGVFRWR
jgi:NADH:ubiquinone oxidoreductase subunit 3 (subunit A)